MAITDTAAIGEVQSRGTAGRFLRWFIVSFIGTLLLSAAWAMANPIDAAPDEGQQAVTAYAVAHGHLGDLNPVVPATYADLTVRDRLLCPHATYDTVATCQNWAAPKSQPDRATFTQFGTYNPVYYAIVGWPSLVLEPHYALYAIRLMSALLFSLAIAAAIGLGAIAFRSRAIGVGVVLAAPPMVLFLGGTINPNGFEIALAILTWIGLLALMRPDMPRPVERLVISVTTAALILFALNRLLSPVWIVVIVLSVLLATRGWARVGHLIARSRYFQVHAALIVIAGLLSVVWSLRHPAVFVGGVHGKVDGVVDFIGIATKQMFVGFPGTTLQQTFGILGFVDFPVQLLVPIFVTIWGALTAGAVLFGRNRFERLTPIALIVFWVVFPSCLAAVIWAGVGWQGRYGLPIAVGVPLLSLFVIAQRVGTHATFSPILRRALRLATVIVLVTDLYCFVINFKRYTNGWSHSWNPAKFDWQPPLGIVVWLLCFVIGSVLVGAVVWRLTRLSSTAHRTATLTAPPADA